MSRIEPDYARPTGASDADRLRAAAAIQAYARTFDVAEGIVTHHVEANSFPNDVDVDYVRLARLEGDLLVLTTQRGLLPDQRPMRFTWTRFTKHQDPELLRREQ